MSAPYAAIRLSFQARLANMPSIPMHSNGIATNGFPQNVAWPGTKFKKDDSKIYLRPVLMKGRPWQPEIGITAQNRYPGYYQIDVLYPTSLNNYSLLDQMILDVCEWFKRGTALSHDGLSFTINEAPEVGNEATETDYIKIPIFIRFLVDSAN